MWLSHLVAMSVPGVVCDKLAIYMLIHIYKNDINNHTLF
jgi:hypothetical protein